MRLKIWGAPLFLSIYLSEKTNALLIDSNLETDFDYGMHLFPQLEAQKEKGGSKPVKALSQQE